MMVGSLMPPTGPAPNASNTPDGKLTDSVGRSKVVWSTAVVMPRLLTPVGGTRLTRMAPDPKEDAGGVGAIAGAAYILAQRSLVDLPTVLIGLTALTILMLTKKIPEPIVILAAGAIGVVLHGVAR